MFGLGGQELLLILFVILIFFGPSKLPDLARGLGRGMREFKKAQADIENEFHKAVESADAKEKTVDPLMAKHSGGDAVSEKS
ncbi:MAG: twin-arginine translocase TatA/TatE family subunit [Chlorobiaceae bacterium]|nr:twin-arginine translocase TatA/TatE family subunit [Chlorobiaceae bacterium]NTV60457.1 twin-arginine translocase TatA/TatE family subunit [Chlorobiaceae bacterium]